MSERLSLSTFSRHGRDWRWRVGTTGGRVRDALAQARSAYRSSLGHSPRVEYDEPAAADGAFERPGGSPLPVFANYRYRQKQAWRLWPPMKAVQLLADAGIVDNGVKNQLREFRGHRALSAPMEEIEQWARPVVEEHRHRFVGDPLEGWAILARRAQLSFRATARAYDLLRYLSRAGVTVRAPADVLDVGAGAGLCAAGFGLLGAAVTAVDNGYGGGGELSTARAVADLLGVSTAVVASSIEAFAEDSRDQFDLVCSTSLLEHVDDLPGTLRAIRCLTRPEGLTVHYIDPFTGPRGGHSILTLDQPYGHLRMEPDSLLRYVEELRPHEVPMAEQWLRDGLLYPCRTGENYVAAFSDAGFDVLMVKRDPAPHPVARNLTLAVRDDIRRWRPDICDTDLVSKGLVVIAQRPSYQD